MAFELSTDNSVLYLYPKGISARTEVLAEVLGIDIVHAVEFSKIGCFCDFPSGSYAEQLLKSTDFGAAVNSWLPSFFQQFP